MKGLARVTVAVLALVALAASAAAASAARPGLDASFGTRGIARLIPPYPPGVRGLEGLEAQPAPDGSAYVVSGASSCAGRCASYLFRFRPGGKPDHSFGDDGYVRLPRQAGSRYALGVDTDSRPIVTWGASGSGAQVLRFTARGRPDRSFGGDGKVWLPQMAENPATIQPLPAGGLLLSTEDFENGGGVAVMRFEELREDGAPLRSFGGDGFAAVQAPGTFHLTPAPTADGSVLIAAEGCCTELVSVVRVSPRGHLDARFDRAARRSLAPLAKIEGEHFEAELQANDIVARPDGGAVLFGEFGEAGIEVRIAADGRPAAGFGKRGVRLLRQPLNLALPLRDGGFLAFGQGLFGPLRSFLLDPGSTFDRRFPSVALSPYSDFNVAAAIGRGAVDVVFDRRRHESSPDVPFVARLRGIPPVRGPVASRG